MEGKNSGVWKVLVIVGSVVILVFFTALVTLFIARSLTLPHCGYTTDSRPLHFTSKPVWDKAERFEIPSKDVVVSRTVDRCYIMPSGRSQEKGKGRPLKLVPEPLTPSQAEAVGTDIVLEICDGVPMYMAVEVIPEFEALRQERRRRQLPTPRPRATPQPYDESKNDNRCMDVIIDCAETVGQKSDCWTGINGLFWMERTCQDEKTIVVEMTKPPGRILKVIQQQWRLCNMRRREGLRC